MTVHKHTTDISGFDYMVNMGIEERDRDSVGIILAVVIMIALTLAQYLGLY